MKLQHLTVFSVLLLTACSQEPAGVRVVNVPTPAPVTAKAKTEPVFYNGKTYQVSLSPTADGAASISIAGMNASQNKDANALATSAFFHFACKDSQKASLQGPAQFSGNIWQAQGRCLG